MNRKILITGGHLTPALAVIEELQKKDNLQIIYVGRKHAVEGEKAPSVEAQIMKELGITFVPLQTGRLQKKFTRFTFSAFLKIPLGFIRALKLLKKHRPDVVLSFGGYLSVPLVFAASVFKIPSLTHEQTTTLGLANRINLLFVKKIALSWPQTLEKTSSPKAVLTGNPLRKEFLKPRQDLWQILKFDPQKKTLLVTGGNLGSRVINRAVAESLPELLAKFNLFHQCGYATGDYQMLQATEKSLPAAKEKRYYLKKYLTGEEMAAIMKHADLVISRAGANTVTEIAYLGKPALFIPIPWSRGNEQFQNAQMLASLGLAQILPQEKASSSSLLELIKKMSGHLSQYQKAAPQARKMVDLQAARKIADLTLQL